MSVVLPSCKRPHQYVLRKPTKTDTFGEADSSSCTTPSRRASLDDDDDDDAHYVMEDDTSIQLIMDMPGVRYQDLEVTLAYHTNTVSIRGHRCVLDKDDRRIMKRHKLHRRLVIDTSVVDVSQAHAYIQGGKLILYAPKIKSSRTKGTQVVAVDEEYETPGALSMQLQQQ